MRFKTLITVGLVSAALGCSGAEKVTDDAMAKAADESEKQTEKAQEEVKAATGKEARRAALEMAANGEHRSDENKARNEFRNPVETLLFFGVEPDSTVVEIWPGRGWYSEVLGPYLAAEGTLVAASFAPDESDPENYRTKVYNEYKQKLDNPIFASTTLALLEPPESIEIGEPESADFVLTFRNFHSFVRDDLAGDVLGAAHDVLKPGGILGVVQHRANEGVDDIKKSAEKGYVPESHVIALAKEAGFELVEKSDINANAKDTKDHPEGVWTLPPSLRLGETDRDKYVAIGESDRMTLKFKKVAKAEETESAQNETAE